MNEQLCKERHKQIDNEIKEIKQMQYEHDAKIEKLSEDSAVHNIEIKNLCSKIDGLITTLKWLIGLLLPEAVALLYFIFERVSN